MYEPGVIPYNNWETIQPKLTGEAQIVIIMAMLGRKIRDSDW